MTAKVTCEWISSVAPLNTERPKEDHFSSVHMTIRGENHTLGNLLREQLLRHPDVASTGYTQPYPNQHMLLFNLTIKNPTAEGLIDESTHETKPLDVTLDTIRVVQNELDLFQKELDSVFQSRNRKTKRKKPDTDLSCGKNSSYSQCK